jgi:S1-C subfamily serine protease
VVGAAELLTEDVTCPEVPVSVRARFVICCAPPPVSGGREGSNVYLGSIPDMGASEVPGLRLSGVRGGSPADVAGLRAGDVIVELGGKTVKDLYSYSDALYSHKPGEQVVIVFLRGAARQSTTVTLGKRGQ